MKGFITSLLLLLWAICFTAQATPQNMDFSQVKNEMPEHWYIGGSEPGNLTEDHPTGSGQSLRLSRTSSSKEDFAYAVQSLPYDYIGKQLTISGWIKTEQVTGEGGAGLWLRLDNGQDMVAFDNMAGRVLTGDQAWQQVQLSIDVPADADTLVFGTLLSGAGKAYYVDLKLTLDGVDIGSAPKPTFLAAAPHEFEQDSGIRLSSLSQQEQNNLTALAKVWGFIKYYHPESAAGNISMDAELFKLIPKVLQADPKTRDPLLVQWINSLGELSACKKCKDSTDAALAHPAQHWLAWQLAPELNNALAKVYAAELPARHYWVKPAPTVGNPVFNENAYSDISYEDSGYRLLTVFRLWNIIHYYSPYRDLTGQPWPQVLPSAIMEVITATTEVDYQLALTKMVYQIGDTHSQFRAADLNVLRPYIGKNVAPIDVRFVEQQAVVYQVYQPELPIKIGDIVTHINDKPINERLAYLQPLAAASNEPTRLSYLAKMLLRDNAEKLKVRVLRKAESFEFQLPLEPLHSIERQRYYHAHGETAYHRLAPDIGYIRLDKIAEVNVDEMMKKLADTKGLIIDIRNYPSNFVVFSLGSHLYSLPYPFAKFTKMQPNNPGQFYWSEAVSVGEYNPDYYQGKVAILVNEQSISQSEYTTMAFRGAAKAKVIGSTTAGADGNVSLIPLPGGHRTDLSGIGVFYPDGKPTQQVGIVPDIEVKPTIAGIAAGRDEQLEAAIDYINQQ